VDLISGKAANVSLARTTLACEIGDRLFTDNTTLA